MALPWGEVSGTSRWPLSGVLMDLTSTYKLLSGSSRPASLSSIESIETLSSSSDESPSSSPSLLCLPRRCCLPAGVVAILACCYLVPCLGLRGLASGSALLIVLFLLIDFVAKKMG